MPTGEWSKLKFANEIESSGVFHIPNLHIYLQQAVIGCTLRLSNVKAGYSETNSREIEAMQKKKSDLNVNLQ